MLLEVAAQLLIHVIEKGCKAALAAGCDCSMARTLLPSHDQTEEKLDML